MAGTSMLHKGVREPMMGCWLVTVIDRRDVACRPDFDGGAKHQPVTAGAGECHLCADAAIPACPIQVCFCLYNSL